MFCFIIFNIFGTGARGLTQVMPATGKRFGINFNDPASQIHVQAKYMRWLLKRYDGNIAFALAGYNAGEGNVDKYKGIPPFKETKNYVSKILSSYKYYKR